MSSAAALGSVGATKFCDVAAHGWTCLLEILDLDILGLAFCRFVNVDAACGQGTGCSLLTRSLYDISKVLLQPYHYISFSMLSFLGRNWRATRNTVRGQVFSSQAGPGNGLSDVASQRFLSYQNLPPQRRHEHWSYLCEHAEKRLDVGYQLFPCIKYHSMFANSSVPWKQLERWGWKTLHGELWGVF